MKLAVVMENDRRQIVITPETEYEIDILEGVKSDDDVQMIGRGSYYNCNGGWTRQGNTEESLIIVMREK